MHSAHWRDHDHLTGRCRGPYNRAGSGNTGESVLLHGSRKGPSALPGALATLALSLMVGWVAAGIASGAGL